jgi:hypothetical protein
MRGDSSARRLCLPALVLLAMAAGAPGTFAADAAESRLDPATAALRHEVAQLRREREVAAGKTFYLKLDAARQRLSLMLQGITLDDYAASGLEIGVPEVLFFDRRPEPDWDTGPISNGRLEPERQRDRIEVVAPAPSAAPSTAPPSPPPVPKSAEEAYSVPSPYRIVFAEGVSLEVVSRGDGRRNRGLVRRAFDALGLRLSDLGSALGLGSKDRVRLRVILEADDAASLYRSLPPEVGLVVIGEWTR